MPYIMGNIPYLKTYIRRHYLHGERKGFGEFVEAIAYGVRCVRGSSLWFQCALGSPYGGAHFMVPIKALAWKPCDEPTDMTYIEPWDCFSSEFGVVEFDFLKRGAALVLPGRVKGQYHCTIDFTGTDLADDSEQHKHLHIVLLETGLVGAFPNNRVLFPDEAFWPTAAEDIEWDLVSFAGECRAEGNEEMFEAARRAEVAEPGKVSWYLKPEEPKRYKTPEPPLAKLID